MIDTELVETVRRYAEHWSRHLGLDNWRFMPRIEPKFRTKNTMMEIQIDQAGYLRAGILIKPNIPEERLADLERDVLHELIHIPLDGMDTVAWAAGGNWQNKHRMEEETAADFFTAVIWRLHEQTECGKPQLILDEMIDAERKKMREAFEKYSSNGDVTFVGNGALP